MAPSLLASFGAYIVTGLGITFSFHRQLTHRSFTTPKWLEYLAAYCGTLAVQGSPIEWVSDHRYHHLHTETALDPHSSYEGFWWAHMGWVLDTEMGEARCQPRSNVADLEAQSALMAVAQSDARKLLAEDPELRSPRGQAARVLLWLMERDQAIRLISVG